jgi:hypothetical protein
MTTDVFAKRMRALLGSEVAKNNCFESAAQQVLFVRSAAATRIRWRAAILGSTQTPPELAALNQEVRHLRDAIYSQIGGWDAPA